MVIFQKHCYNIFEEEKFIRRKFQHENKNSGICSFIGVIMRLRNIGQYVKRRKQDNIDPERIGIIGICGWGGMAINAAAMDTRIKATVASTMYDMTRVNAKGYFDSADNADARYAAKKAMNGQRTKDYKSGTYYSSV